VEFDKRFLIIGNVQATPTRRFFRSSGRQLWMGVTITAGTDEFRVPDHYPLNAASFAR